MRCKGIYFNFHKTAVDQRESVMYAGIAHLYNVRGNCALRRFSSCFHSEFYFI